jgi:seryl-tRNA synthetase
MHDLNFFRDHLDLFAEMAKKRNITLDLNAFRVLDKERRELITENEQRKAQRNKTSDEIARLKKEKQSADALIAEMRQVSERIKQADERISELDARQRETLLTIPIFPIPASLMVLAPTATRKSAAGAQLPNSIFNPSRTGK